MAALTETYVDPLGTSSATGNDYEGSTFTDGVSSSSGTVVTKTGAFTGTRIGDKIFLTDNGSGNVTPLLRIVTARTDDTITVADIRSGGSEATDVKCTLADGTINLAFATLQFALDKISRDTVNGDRLNIKAGNDDNVLAAALSLTAYGTPILQAQLIFEGYTSSVGDGGIGGISGADTYTMLAPNSIDYVGFRNMHLHKSGSANIVDLDNSCLVIGCEIDDTTGYGITLDSNANVSGNYVHNVGNGINAFNNSMVYHNYLSIADGASLIAIVAAQGVVVAFNCIRLTGAGTDSRGITYRDDSKIFNNSIWSQAGTGKGISQGGTTNWGIMIFNNCIEGFSGSGGVGIETVSDDDIIFYGANQIENCTNETVLNGDEFGSKVAADVSLGATPFADVTSSTQDFEASDAVKDATLYSAFKGGFTSQFIDAGAGQQREPAGGGSASGVRNPMGGPIG